MCPSVVGRAVGLDASSVEASSHLHNIGKDSPKKYACTHHGEKGNWFRWLSSRGVVGVHPRRPRSLQGRVHPNTASPRSALSSMSRSKRFLAHSIFPVLRVSKFYLNWPLGRSYKAERILACKYGKAKMYS